MKRTPIKYFYILLFMFSSIFSFGGKAFPDYFIVKTKQDSTLQKNEAIFVFNFTNNEEGSMKDRLIKFSYNVINTIERINKSDQILLKVLPGKYQFQFFYKETFYEIKIDSILIDPGHRTEIRLNFKSSIHPVMADKPVIYVYSPQKLEVKIKLDVKGNLNFTYPQYKNGWEFTTTEDGTIKMDSKIYSYLFWDGKLKINSKDIHWKEGFIVNKESLVSFFEDKLSKMGLNSKEMEDYITYWCPLMNVNETNYIHFIFNEAYNEYARLTVNPKPDNQFRVFMVWSKAATNTIIKEQTIPSFKREGFTLVEWGGAYIENMQEFTTK